MTINWPVVRYVCYLLVLTFIAGMYLGLNRYPPSQVVELAQGGIIDLATYWKNDLGIEPTRHLVPAKPGRKALSIIDPAAMADGNRLISGLTPFDEALNGVWLLDREGRRLHYWPVDYELLDPDGRSSRNAFVHGVAPLADGSVVVTFDGGAVIAKIGPCGDTLWATDGVFHHAVSRSYDGTLWSLMQNPDSDVDQMLVQLDPESGEILRRISLLDDVIGPNALQGLFDLRMADERGPGQFLEDPFHANDVEILSPEFAGAFPNFSAGDILISLRSINLVAVLDGTSYDAKWWSHGPWYRQHDPDFLPDGTISILNNNMYHGTSEIVRIDPTTGDYRVAFRGSEQAPFYTWIRGKHQTLDNGNILITESMAGRVFEVDSAGRIVWEFQNIYDETRNGVLGNAMVLPEDFFDDGALDCPSNG